MSGEYRDRHDASFPAAITEKKGRICKCHLLSYLSALNDLPMVSDP